VNQARPTGRPDITSGGKDKHHQALQDLINSGDFHLDGQGDSGQNQQRVITRNPARNKVKKQKLSRADNRVQLESNSKTVSNDPVRGKSRNSDPRLLQRKKPEQSRPRNRNLNNDSVEVPDDQSDRKNLDQKSRVIGRKIIPADDDVAKNIAGLRNRNNEDSGEPTLKVGSSRSRNRSAPKRQEENVRQKRPNIRIEESNEEINSPPRRINVSRIKVPEVKAEEINPREGHLQARTKGRNLSRKNNNNGQIEPSKEKSTARPPLRIDPRPPRIKNTNERTLPPNVKSQPRSKPSTGRGRNVKVSNRAPTTTEQGKQITDPRPRQSGVVRSREEQNNARPIINENQQNIGGRSENLRKEEKIRRIPSDKENLGRRPIPSIKPSSKPSLGRRPIPSIKASTIPIDVKPLGDSIRIQESARGRGRSQLPRKQISEDLRINEEKNGITKTSKSRLRVSAPQSSEKEDQGLLSVKSKTKVDEINNDQSVIRSRTNQGRDPALIFLRKKESSTIKTGSLLSAERATPSTKNVNSVQLNNRLESRNNVEAIQTKLPAIERQSISKASRIKSEQEDYDYPEFQSRKRGRQKTKENYSDVNSNFRNDYEFEFDGIDADTKTKGNQVVNNVISKNDPIVFKAPPRTTPKTVQNKGAIKLGDQIQKYLNNVHEERQRQNNAPITEKSKTKINLVTTARKDITAARNDITTAPKDFTPSRKEITTTRKDITTTTNKEEFKINEENNFITKTRNKARLSASAPIYSEIEDQSVLSAPFYDLEKALKHAELTWAADPFRNQDQPLPGKPSFDIDYSKNTGGQEKTDNTEKRFAQQEEETVNTREITRTEYDTPVHSLDEYDEQDNIELVPIEALTWTPALLTSQRQPKIG